METILILYGSITGNTEATAVLLQTELTVKYPEKTFTLLNVRDIEIEALTDAHRIFFGTSTWDDACNPDTEDFLHKIQNGKPDFSTMKFALFGLGDSSYPDFCGGLPIVEKALTERSASVYSKYFTIDGYPTDQITKDMIVWAVDFLTKS